ncbi:MAG: hypothetical protein COB51_11855 [Moraxellaceae bacterium]|nr:MAG: hypothetical protein COB51_11855 [Moraxellaceae bacterium]
MRFLTILFCCLIFVACSSKDSSQGDLLSTDDAASEWDNREVFDDDSGIFKPVGTYTGFIDSGFSLSHSQAIGGLVRVRWGEIEPSNDHYDWQLITDQVEKMDAFSQGKPWSLAIAGGKEAPAWLYDEGVASYQVVTARSGEVKLPKFWDENLQFHLADFANDLAARFGDDERLILIYLPQMTVNGVEGHFNSVDYEVLEAAGLTADVWIDAVKDAAVNFALAFPTKAIAVELHDILGSAEIPIAIMNELWNDPQLGHRVGVGMWWISGDEQAYQQDLLNALELFPGDIYGQIIGRSDQVDRFPEGYVAVFEQAKKIGMRYIEPWNYEFLHFTQDEALQDFNEWAFRIYE